MFLTGFIMSWAVVALFAPARAQDLIVKYDQSQLMPLSRPVAAIITDIRRELAAAKLPTGFFTSLEGTFQAQEESMRTIAGLSVISLAMIFAILYSRYRSVLFALIPMMTLAMAAVAAVVWVRREGALGTRLQFTALAAAGAAYALALSVWNLGL